MDKNSGSLFKNHRESGRKAVKSSPLNMMEDQPLTAASPISFRCPLEIGPLELTPK